MCKINYYPIIDKIKNLIAKRNLTLLGKITIVKSFLTSQLVYMLSVFPCFDNSLIKQIEGDLYKFIWNSKPNKIKRRTLIGPIDRGGTKTVDIQMQNTAIQTGWIKRWRSVSGVNGDN